MDRNYCFRRKRHSYAACDAALAASILIKYVLIEKKNVYTMFAINLFIFVL